MYKTPKKAASYEFERDKMGKILDELKPSFGHEKWFKDAEKRENVKTDRQLELDRNMNEECQKGNSEKALRLIDEGGHSNSPHFFLTEVFLKISSKA